MTKTRKIAKILILEVFRQCLKQNISNLNNNYVKTKTRHAQ